MGLRGSWSDLRDNGQVGDWCFLEGEGRLDMILRYPVSDETWVEMYREAPELNRGDVVRIPLPPSPADKEPVWQWDGNREAPTLSPSINVIGRWHGFLRAGKLITV